MRPAEGRFSMLDRCREDRVGWHGILQTAKYVVVVSLAKRTTRVLVMPLG